MKTATALCLLDARCWLTPIPMPQAITIQNLLGKLVVAHREGTLDAFDWDVVRGAANALADMIEGDSWFVRRE